MKCKSTSGWKGFKMNLGKKIKSLRLKKAVTQEQLANYLNISAQSVSKWENEISLPDLTLLPDISVYFGVTIDELFDITEQVRFERIEHMLEIEDRLSNDDFKSTEEFLHIKITDEAYQGRALSLLAELYNHKADELRKMAEYYAKEALQVNPEDKMNHVNLQRAQEGTMPDWDYANHSKRIAYYQEFVKKNPTYARGYLWLLDELIADHRIKDAKSVLLEMKKLDQSCRVPYYQGKIEWMDGNHANAIQIWEKMADEFHDDWLAQSCMADCMASICEYDKAIHYFKKAYELQPSPKYTDTPWSIAQIQEIKGDYASAIEALQDMLCTLKTEWNTEEGAEVERIQREISRLKKLQV